MSSFEEEQLARLKTLAAAQMDALTAMADGRLEYSMNTGQTTVKVTRQNLSEVQSQYSKTLDMIRSLEARLYGGGIVVGRPMC